MPYGVPPLTLPPSAVPARAPAPAAAAPPAPAASLGAAAAQLATRAVPKEAEAAAKRKGLLESGVSNSDKYNLFGSGSLFFGMLRKTKDTYSYGNA